VTTTGNVAVFGLPDGSVAVQLTVVVPTGNSEPEGGVHEAALTGPELSTAGTAP
jgi:hypothetical protein